MSYPLINVNPLTINGGDFHAQYSGVPYVDWTVKGLYITRLRLIGDGGVLDVSYCYGQLDGKPVRVNLPFDQLPLRGHKRAIVEFAKRDKVYAQGLGVFDNISILH